MSGPHPRLTQALVRELARRIRAGAFEQVAAESLGVPFAVYQDWLTQGSGPDAQPLRRELFQAVQKARAHARLMAEMHLRSKEPKVWLLHGPGKETAELPGWSAPARARAEGDGPAINVLEHPDVLALFAKLHEALLPFPEARAAVLALLPASDNAGEQPAVPAN